MTSVPREAVFIVVFGIGSLLTWNAALILGRDAVDSEQIARYDLEYFHRAYEVLDAGQNPYDVRTLNDPVRFPRDLHDFSPREVKYVYPPWVLMLLKPVLTLPIETAATLWSVTIAVFLALSLALTAVAAGSSVTISGMGALIVFALFPPFVDMILWGNIEILVVSGIALLFWTSQSSIRVSQKHPDKRPPRADAVDGLALALLSTKPHLSAPVLLGYVLLMRPRELVKPLLYCVLLIGILWVKAEAQLPGLTAHWMNSWGIVDEHLRTVNQRTLVNALSIVTGNLLEQRGEWMRVPWSIVCQLIVGVFLLYARRSGLRLHRALPWLAGLGIIIAPYSWFHDHSLFFLAGELVLLKSFSKRSAPGSVRSREKEKRALPRTGVELGGSSSESPAALARRPSREAGGRFTSAAFGVILWTLLSWLPLALTREYETRFTGCGPILLVFYWLSVCAERRDLKREETAAD